MRARARTTLAVLVMLVIRVAFTPVTTPGLRLALTMQPQWSAGLHEWKVK
jgi:autotransporter translocation and assembly factor TamB